MDCFNDVFIKFLCLGTFQLHYCLWRIRKLIDLIKNILICVLNEGLTGLERHEGEQLITEFFNCLANYRI